MSKKVPAVESLDPPASGGKKSKKGRKSQSGAGPEGGDLAIRVGAHPRARRSICRARAYAGMVAFALVLLLALRAGVPAFEALLRALAGGLVLHFTTWAFAITLWRRLIVVELEHAHAQMLERASAGPSPATASTTTA